MNLFKFVVLGIYVTIMKNRQTFYVFVYIVFIALLTQCIINIVDSVQQIKEPFLDLEKPVIKQERAEVNYKYKSSKSHIRPPPGTQMGQMQIEGILKVLPKKGNLLVWGLGYDSPFWYKSTRGKVVFIEPAGYWYDVMTDAYPYLAVYKVSYTTDLIDSFYKYLHHREIWSDLDLRSQLPKVVTDTFWHIIIVDAPEGFGEGPGRYQSIYTSSLLARKGTHIFVDDYERRVEYEYSRKMLGQPIEVVKRHRVGGLVEVNLQAHFLQT